jgi:hypothetical protein
MGEVYRATDTKLGREVAADAGREVKVLDFGLAKAYSPAGVHRVIGP